MSEHALVTRIQGVVGYHVLGGRLRSSFMVTKTTYGLMPCIWRALRAKHPGFTLTVYGRDGLAIGTAYLHRDESLITLPESMDFRAISWKQTIERTPVSGNPIIGPTAIPIGTRTRR